MKDERGGVQDLSHLVALALLTVRLVELLVELVERLQETRRLARLEMLTDADITAELKHTLALPARMAVSQHHNRPWHIARGQLTVEHFVGL